MTTIIQSPGPPVSPAPVVVMVPPTVCKQPMITGPKAMALTRMGVAQIILGVMLIFFNIIANATWAEISFYVGPGYWCGFFAVLTGAFGASGGENKKRSIVITFMVLSILSAVIMTGSIVSGALGLWVTDENQKSWYSYHWYYNVPASFATNSLLMIAGIIAFILAIVSSVLCCKALEGAANAMPTQPAAQCYSNPIMYNGQVQNVTPWYPQVANMGQPVVYYQHPQQQVFAQAFQPPPPYQPAPNM